jgi:hypothetical protein
MSQDQPTRPIERVCWCCEASRDDPRDQLFARDGDHEPLCRGCYEAEYGTEESSDAQS